MKKYLILAAVALVMASCNKNKKDADAAMADATTEVKITQVHSSLVPQTETYTATVESDVKNNISPNMSYRIERILVDVGDHVSAGQCVVQLDQSSLQQLQLQIQNQQSVVNNYKTDFNRIAELYKIGGVSKAEYDNSQVTYQTQMSQLNVLKTQYAQMSKNTQLFAPISGIVTARNYDNGDMYSGQPILTIEKTNPVKVIVAISETHYKEVKVGQHFDIELDAYPGEKFAGRATIINPSVDSSTHTFDVEVTISNPGQKVRPGMFARATVNFGSQNRVLVPDEALVKQIGAGDRYVYVYDAKTQTVSYDKVELGKHIGKNYEILSGVSNGAQVVIAGQSRLNNGKKVKVVNGGKE